MTTPTGVKAQELFWNAPLERCPNCGKPLILGYSSIANHGNVLISTLYGVCKPCADAHRHPTNPHRR